MARLDLAKLADWFDAHGRSLVLFARQVLPPDAQSSADDVVQDLFVRLLAQSADSDGIPEPPNPAAWLYRCVRNACLDERRRQTRRRRHEASPQVTGPEWFEPQSADLIDARLAGEMLAALPDLPRQVVTLRLWSGLTLAEIADVTGQPVSTVHDQYRRALADIRRAMQARAADSRSRYEQSRSD